jgi:hypothetical protein
VKDNFEESQNALDYAEDIEVDVTPKEFSGELEVELKDTFPSGKCTCELLNANTI